MRELTKLAKLMVISTIWLVIGLIAIVIIELPPFIAILISQFEMWTATQRITAVFLLPSFLTLFGCMIRLCYTFTPMDELLFKSTDTIPES